MSTLVFKLNDSLFLNHLIKKLFYFSIGLMYLMFSYSVACFLRVKQILIIFLNSEMLSTLSLYSSAPCPPSLYLLLSLSLCITFWHLCIISVDFRYFSLKYPKVAHQCYWSDSQWGLIFSEISEIAIVVLEQRAVQCLFVVPHCPPELPLCYDTVEGFTR